MCLYFKYIHSYCNGNNRWLVFITKIIILNKISLISITLFSLGWVLCCNTLKAKLTYNFPNWFSYPLPCNKKNCAILEKNIFLLWQHWNVALRFFVAFFAFLCRGGEFYWWLTETWYSFEVNALFRLHHCCPAIVWEFHTEELFPHNQTRFFCCM